MGTRHLTAVFLDGEYRIAQYGQWDGYPSGQGVTILDFLKKEMNRDKFKKQLKKCRFVPKEQLEGKTYDDFPMMHRDHGGKILSMVQEYKGSEILLKNDIDFSSDSLFCEYAYVIDFDDGTFEVYKGFSKRKTKGQRFSNSPVEKDSKYAPIRLTKKYRLSKLPSNKAFLKDIKD